MNILTSILGLVAKLGFLWRIIGIAGAIFLFNQGCKDLSFLNGYKTRKSFTIEELMAMKPSEIPAYLTVANAVPTGTGVIQTMTRRRGGKTQTYIYPVFSLNQIVAMNGDSTGVDTAQKPVVQVILKKGFSGSESEAAAKIEETIKGVEGTYDDESLGDDVRKLLEEDGYKIAAIPIIIEESHRFPTTGGAYTQIMICLLVILLVIGSFWWQFAGRHRAQA